MTIEIKEEDYEKAVEQNLGWCPNCRDFTKENVEPDAMYYECPVCTECVVMGAEQALVVDEIEFEENFHDEVED